MIIEVVVLFVRVVLNIEVVLVEVSEHVDSIESISELLVVMEGDGSEGVEDVSINGSGSGEVVPLGLSGLLFLCLRVRLIDEGVPDEDKRVEGHMSRV